MPRQRKPKATKAVILPPELDDDSDEEQGSVIPDDDGWITLEGDNGPVAEGGRDTGAGKANRAKQVAGKSPKRRTKRAD